MNDGMEGGKWGLGGMGCTCSDVKREIFENGKEGRKKHENMKRREERRGKGLCFLGFFT